MALISIGELADAVADALEEEGDEIRQSLDEILAHAANDLKKLRTARRPKDTGAYARGWRRKSETWLGKKVWVVYNTAKPWLTWVVEYGDRTRGGKNLISRSIDDEVEKITAELASKLGK